MFGTIPIDVLLGSKSVSPTLINRDAPANGNVTPYELEVIASLVRAASPQAIFEIGTFDGRTTLNMAANAPPGVPVFTLDLPPEGLGSTAFSLELNEDMFVKKDRSGSRFVDAGTKHNIKQLYGDSGRFDFSTYYGMIDFMFIDGSHAYEYVKSDTLKALRVVREGGTIIWHDYVREGFTPFPGVPWALKEFFCTDARFANIAQIENTSIVYLRIPKGQSDSAFQPRMLGDSSHSEYLAGELYVTPSAEAASGVGPVAVNIATRNTGRALWLPSDSPVGPVRVAARLLDFTGDVINMSYWRADLPHRRAVFPGETVEFQAEIPRPDIDQCTVEFDLVADGVAWFDLPRRPRIVFGVESIAAQQSGLMAQVETLAQRLEGLSARIDAMTLSTSWRITAPLRALRKLFRTPDPDA